MVALSLLDEVIQGLEQDQNSTRIKKLLIYACRNNWESDPHRLSSIHLRVAVEEALQIAPTLEQLRQRLDKAVKTLNKPAQYALVAGIITNHLKRLYPDDQDTTQVVVHQDNGCLEVAQRLEQEPEKIRIKKLLFSACSSAWENDSERLNRVPLVNLVQQLYQLTSNIEELKAVLYSIVRTLNRQAEYTLVANIAIAIFEQYLYPPTRLKSAARNTDQNSEQTQISAPLQTESTAANASTPSVNASAQSSNPVSLTAESEAVASNDLSSDDPKDRTNLFDLRLEIMKYTSPLRAKVLIFSLLYYPLNPHSSNWSSIRSRNLDDLLSELLEAYDGFDVLEARLKTTAKILEDSDQYLQAAGAIARAMNSFYPNSRPNSSSSQVPNQQQAGQRGRGVPEQSASGSSPSAAPDAEDSCSFFSSAEKALDHIER